MLTIYEDWCKACMVCVDHCPQEAFEVSDVLNRKGVYPPRLKQDHTCNHCRLCEYLCPDFAITVTLEEGNPPEKTTGKLILGGITSEV